MDGPKYLWPRVLSLPGRFVWDSASLTILWQYLSTTSSKSSPYVAGCQGILTFISFWWPDLLEVVERSHQNKEETNGWKQRMNKNKHWYNIHKKIQTFPFFAFLLIVMNIYDLAMTMRRHNHECHLLYLFPVVNFQMLAASEVELFSFFVWFSFCAVLSRPCMTLAILGFGN